MVITAIISLKNLTNIKQMLKAVCHFDKFNIYNHHSFLKSDYAYNNTWPHMKCRTGWHVQTHYNAYLPCAPIFSSFANAPADKYTVRGQPNALGDFRGKILFE